jgi:hypothetical protein
VNLGHLPAAAKITLTSPASRNKLHKLYSLNAEGSKDDLGGRSASMLTGTAKLLSPDRGAAEDHGRPPRSKPLAVDAYHELVMDDYKRYRQEARRKQDLHKRAQAETAAYLQKQMDAKRLQR